MMQSVPTNWQWKKFAEVCTMITDGTHMTPKYVERGIPFISTANLVPYGENFDFTSYAKLISKEEHEELTKRAKPKKGDILVSKCGTIGRTQVVRVDYDFSIFVGLMLLKVKRDLALPSYLEFYLNQPFVTKQLKNLAVGSSRATLTIGAMKEYGLPLPPLKVQQHIVYILEKAQKAKQEREQANLMTNKILQAVFLQMFGDPELNQMGWRVTTFGNLVIDMRYGTSVKCASEGKGTPILRIPNVVNGEIERIDLKYAELAEDELERLVLSDGDMLFVRTNGNREYVGRSAVFHEADERFAFASYLIRARPSQELNADFANVYLTLPYVRKQIFQNARTSAGQYNVNTKGLKALKFFVPPASLQRKFAAFAQQMKALKKMQQHATEETNQLFVSLASRAFKGELVTEVN